MTNYEPTQQELTELTKLRNAQPCDTCEITQNELELTGGTCETFTIALGHTETETFSQCSNCR